METPQQQQAPMINVSAETKQNADVFMTTLTSMFETIEALANDGIMKEGDYVKLSREFVKLSQLKDQVKITTIYIEQERVARLGRVIERKKLSKQQKLDDEKNYKMCPSCKKVIKKKSFAKHTSSGICKHIADVKGVCAYNAGEKKLDERRVKLTDKSIKGGRSLVERSLILAERLKFKKLNQRGMVYGVDLDIKLYNDDEEFLQTKEMRVAVYNLRHIGEYRRTEKGWIKKEPYEKSTLPLWIKNALVDLLNARIIPVHLQKVASTKKQVSEWKKVKGTIGFWTKQKTAVKKPKKQQPKPIPEPKCECCSVDINKEKDVYHEDVKLWVCLGCEATEEPKPEEPRPAWCSKEVWDKMKKESVKN